MEQNKAWKAGARTFEEVAVDVGGAKEEGIIVIGDDAVHEALFVQPRALCLCLHGCDDIRDAKQLQQLLAVPANSYAAASVTYCELLGLY